MNETERELRVEGIMRAFVFHPGSAGKQFLGARLECADGRDWVLTYDEQSPFHAFADRRVAAVGEPCVPDGQRIGGERIAGHLQIRHLQLAEEAPEARLKEILAGHNLGGRFKETTTAAGDSLLSFVTDGGDTFLVANDPAGAAAGPRVEVWAYPVRPTHLAQKTNARYLWVICPCSVADLQAWRERRARRG